ncbi:NADP-dependent aryl-alcohol dehydrogenase [Pseudoclavibacter endophyticus]|uniref:Aldo/keto reductase n=1 Tax=Pseudoclavibacter endophyticus TaxID=1778590 RepID=A0A6H9WSR6_9MICO|nr:aldo/keto reductase [Pseudoclavibacter endophyticus]KAB1649340.1 aldo/keto reductase [Pseudoclavibacter endophyticus]GGA63353.1 NADP-dependent aryl-alcohol dehydrogenase [Pseudoclavibacter endophyticus]
MKSSLDTSATGNGHPRRSLGGALDVFPVALGTNPFGWTSSDDEAAEVLDAYTAGGGNFIDTADSYPHWAEGRSGGESEQAIGRWLAGGRAPDDLIIATKVAQHPEFLGLSPDNVRAAADASLRRLGVERIDVYYAHFDDEATPLTETVRVFSSLVDEGLVGHVAISNYSPQRLREWMEITEREGFHRPIAHQPHYSLMERGIEADLLPLDRELGLSVVPYFSLAKGFLTGKYRPGVQIDSPRAPQASAYLETPRGERVLAALDGISGRLKVEPGAVALAWLLAQPGVVAPIASARNASQVPMLLDAARISLDPSEVEELTRAAAA